MVGESVGFCAVAYAVQAFFLSFLANQKSKPPEVAALKAWKKRKAVSKVVFITHKNSDCLTYVFQIPCKHLPIRKNNPSTLI
ncbi:hypothetical protein BKI52_41700 [marine bacterium AO1-C]|nr:hypothetical protein BKI52_41700 [marine bacterium AO1-C]